MKILLVTRRFYPDIIGGGEISAFFIAKSLVELDNEVHVLTFTEGKSRKEKIGKVHVYRNHIPYINLPFIRYFFNLEYMFLQMAKTTEMYVRKLKPEVVHLLNADPISITPKILKKRFDMPIVATINTPDLMNFMGVKSFKSCINRWGILKGAIYYPYVKLNIKIRLDSIRYIDKLFPVSKAIEEGLLKEGIKKKRLAVIHNPMTNKKKVKSNLKKELKIKNKKVILYAGRLSKDKGIQNVIKAMPYINNAVFLIAGGKRNYYKRLKRLVEKLRLENKVKFIGWIEQKEMKNYYSIVDVAVLTGTFFEPLSRMLLEAQSFGIPVIASNIGGNSEIIENGKNGMLLKNLETDGLVKNIKYILDNPKQGNRMGEYGKKKIEKEFSPKIIGNQLIKEYKSLIK